MDSLQEAGLSTNFLQINKQPKTAFLFDTREVESVILGVASGFNSERGLLDPRGNKENVQVIL